MPVLICCVGCALSFNGIDIPARIKRRFMAVISGVKARSQILRRTL